MKKLSEADYEFLVPYKNKKDLDKTMDGILTEMHRIGNASDINLKDVKL